MPARTVAIGGLRNATPQGSDDNAADARARKMHAEISQNAATGNAVLQILMQASLTPDDCIQALAIFSHGNADGLILQENEGFYVQALNGMGPNAATLDILQQLIQGGHVRFCRNAVIKLTGCNTGAGQFAQRLSAITGATVYAAGGRCAPVVQDGKETGWFSSDPPGWKKYQAGQEIPNPYVNDPTLTQPNRPGTNLLRVWAEAMAPADEGPIIEAPGPAPVTV